MLEEGTATRRHTRPARSPQSSPPRVGDESRPTGGGGRSRRWIKRVIVAVVVIVVVVVAVAAVLVLPARDELQTARSAVRDGARLLAAGEALDAGGALRRGEDLFTSVERRLQRSPVRVAGGIPLVGRTVDTLRDVASAGRMAAEAGAAVAEGVASLPDGALTLAPEDGTIPLRPLTALQPHLAHADQLVTEAVTLLSASPRRWVLSDVASGHAQLIEELAPVADTLSTAAALSRGLPPLLGDEGPRRYVLGAANPAEARGTGGLIGAYAILTAEDGQLRISEFRAFGTLGVLSTDEVQAPHADFARRYNQFGGAGHLSNVNMTPDFPSAAVAILNHYEVVEDERLDGVIVADPFALQALLELTGPVDIPNVRQVDAAGVVEYLSNEAYEDFDTSAVRKPVLGEVASGVLDEFLNGDVQASPQEVVRVLGDVVAERRLQFHSTDPDVQRALTEAGLTGALPDPAGDFLAVVPNNGAANKADFYTEWDIHYEVWLEDEGDARAKVRVVGHNDTPTQGHLFVVGANVDYLKPGDNLTYLSVFCAPGCTASHTEQDEGQRWPGTEVDAELGYRTLSTWQWAPSGGSTSMEYTLKLEDVWSGPDASGGKYQLRLQTPPMSVPAQAEVIIHPPHPLKITDASGPLQIEAGQAVWRGDLERPQKLWVKMERPLADTLGYQLRSYGARFREFWDLPSN